MSYTHDRDITLEGWIVHTSQANAKGTIKEHRNPILESRCKSKRGMESELSSDGTWTNLPYRHFCALLHFISPRISLC
jgi:hypothetical protein